MIQFYEISTNSRLTARSIILLIVCFFIIVSSKSQVIRNETLSSMGSSSEKSTSGLVVHQSIGQLSVIGNFSDTIVKGNQGFLRGLLTDPFLDWEPFRVLPFPNSFSSKITFRFLPRLSKEASFFIYDMGGKIVYQNSHKPLNDEVTLTLDFLSNALYLVIIQSGNRVFQTRIIKNT